MTKILAFAGSARKESFNKKLVNIAAVGAKEAGAEVTVIDLADFDMPLFNQDLEADKGLPDNAQKFKRLLIEHDGFLIASPEYNSAFSPLLKNAIDWASRAQSDDEPSLIAYRGKYAAVMAASPGGLGGMRGLVFLRMLLGNIGVTVIPEQQAISQALNAFDESGNLIDEGKQAAIINIGARLANVLKKLH